MQEKLPITRINLQAVEQDFETVDLTAEFLFPPQKPSVDFPGSQPGDLLLIEKEENTHVVRVSLGKVDGFSVEIARQAGGVLGKWLTASGAQQIELNLDSLAEILADRPGFSLEDITTGLCEGVKLGAYRFDRYKQTDDETKTITIVLRAGKSLPETQSLAVRIESITNAVMLARDLCHEPANVINPATLAERAAEVARQHHLQFRIIEEQQLAQMGAGAILAVGRGSLTPPRLIVLEYAGERDTNESQPVILVGKAITFDTGGYSVKSTDGIVGMKYDKCGGIAVLAILQAAAELKLKTPVVGIIAAAENMISADAYRPDDIITTLNGKTVEIVSTDAEGRLVLADALAFAQRDYKPRALVDLATLTGGVVVALGRVRAGLLSNDDQLADRLFAAGEKTFERLWRLPLDEDYTKNIKGDDADLKNSGGREGHCILGGAFIQEFVQPGIPWAHLDIAGTATTTKDMPYAPKGATGFGVRLLLEYLQSLEKE